MAQVFLTGRLICRNSDDRARVLRHLPEHIRLTRAEPGCKWFDVTQNAADKLVFDVDECFADRAAFEAHQTRTRASAWFEATQGIERDFALSD
jgi:quinol monooxygenase YgiN